VPTVPTYDSFQVAPGALPQTRMTMPEMPDVAGQQAQQMGQAMQRAGGEIGRIAMEEAQKANQVRIDDGLTQYVKAVTDLEVEALQLRGRNALERPDGKALPDEYGEKANKVADAIEASLGNQMQREAFRQRVAQLQGQFHKKLTLHMVAAQKDYVREQRQATLDTAVYRGGVLWGDGDAVQQSADTIRLTVEQQLKDDGLHGDEKIRQSRMIAALTPLHTAVLNGMVDNNRVDLARDYYKNNSATMSLQARDNAMKVIEAGDFEARTQDQADSLFARHKGNISAALAEARANLSGKEGDAVVGRLKTYDAERVALRERGQRDAADQAWQLVSQGKRVPPSLLASMDGRDAIAVRKVLTEGTPVKTDVGKWLEFTNLPPATLATLTPQQLMRDYRPYFSDADLRNADQMIQAAKGLRGGKPNQDGLQLMTTADLLKRTAIELKILPASGKPDESEQNRYLAFTDRMQIRVNQWEAANGKKASPEILRTLLDEEKLNTVRYDEWGTDKDRPYISLTPEQQAKAYVKVGDEEIKLSAVPMRRRAQIIEALQAKGQPVTETEIARLWVKAGKPK
jgi:hypothetical protein